MVCTRALTLVRGRRKQLEDAIRMLRALVEKVEAHLEKKRCIRSLHVTSSASMVPSGAYRTRETERSSGAQYSDDSQESVQFAVAYEADASKAGDSTSASTQRLDHEQQHQSPRARTPISPAALETPLDAYRQHHHTSARRRPDDVHRRNSHHERFPRLAVPYEDEDDGMVLYDRWGRPVLRHDRSIDSSTFESVPGGDASADVAHRPTVQSVPMRVPRRRHYSYSDESEWRVPARGFAHVAPAAPSERAASPSSPVRRMQAPMRQRYVPYPYHYSDIVYDDADGDAYESERRGRVDSHASAAMLQPEERYLGFEREDVLEREEGLLAAQEYAIASSARAHAAYTVRRSDTRRSVHFRDASPLRYTGKRAALSNAHYGREYFDGDWLSDDDADEYDDDEVMYRRYPRHAAAATLYPPPHLYVDVHAPNGSRRHRYSSYPSPSGRQHLHHTRAGRPESPQSKRRKVSSGVLELSELMRHDRADHDDAVALKDRHHQHRCSEQEQDERNDVQLQDATGPLPRHSETLLSDPAPPVVATRKHESVRADVDMETDAQATGSTDAASHTTANDVQELPGGVDTRSETRELAEDDVVLKSVSDHDEPTTCDAKAHELQEGDVVGDDSASAVPHTRDVSMRDASVGAQETEPATCAGELAPVDPEYVGATDASSELAPLASTTITPPIELCRTSPLNQAPAGDAARARTVDVTAQSARPTETQHPSWRVRANALLATALERDSALDAACAEAEREAQAQLKRYAAVETKRKDLAQLDALAMAAYELQCLVVSAKCGLELSVRREMLRLLDDAVQASVRAASTPTENLASLRAGIEQALALANVDVLVDTNLSAHDDLHDSSCTDAGVASLTGPTTPDAPALGPSANSVEEPPAPRHDSIRLNNNWSDGVEWFENTDDPLDTASAELKAPTESTAESTAPSTASFALKTVDDDHAPLAATTESSSLYPSTLFSAISACSPTSFVMKGMQKRLFSDIARADAYHYLHTAEATSSDNDGDGADNNAGGTAAPAARPPCDFGCSATTTAGAVQKVVAQISSRMKWFDEVTYALARARSGTDAASECLSRKKMNSTIRKLHLMAIQLHCLVSHLYCVRGHAACSARSSLPAALNSSFFEKRMIAYKAKLKLDSDLHGAPDELLRDTFEFFPEFLLCIEMWGYDYRECSAASPSQCDSSKIRSRGKALPLAFFARVESGVLDYDGDANGHLHAICEELLAIVCLWNDFVWGDDLANRSLARIATFEAEMKRSAAKILQTYALHLMGSWAIRLLANPDELQSLRFTQQNAYYAESSKMRGLASSAALASVSLSSAGASAKAPSDGDRIDDDDRESVSAYWKQKLDDGELEKREALAAPLRPEAIERWSKVAASAHLLKWSRVFQLRGELETCGVVLSDFVSDVVRASASLGQENDDEDASSESEAMALLEVFAKARVLGTDVAKTCETIALHSASTQLPQEAPPHATDNSPATPNGTSAIASAAPAPSSDATIRTTRTGACATAAAPSSPTDLSTGDAALPQPDVKDLVQILASTRKEVDEIFCARTRSGRTRKKLQVQSLQLAQQTLEVFHTIATLRST